MLIEMLNKKNGNYTHVQLPSRIILCLTVSIFCNDDAKILH